MVCLKYANSPIRFKYFLVGAQMQNIVYGEFLPTILGAKYMKKYNLLAEDSSQGYYSSKYIQIRIILIFSGCLWINTRSVYFAKFHPPPPRVGV